MNTHVGDEVTRLKPEELNGARWVPTFDQRAILEGLIAEQEKETTAAEFVRNYLPFGPEKWSKIKASLNPRVVNGVPTRSYFDEIKDPENLIEELRTLLEEIPLRRAQAERLNSQHVFELSKFRALKVAVDECRSKRTPERLVKFLAPTGGGKTMLCNYLAKKCGARIVESREAWKRSYITVLEDVSRALGLRLDGENRPTRIEDRLIEVFSAQTTVLAIDEGEYFGGQAINGIKLLLNKTRLVIVIAAIAEAHDRWNRYYKLEAEQLDRRTHAIVELTNIEPKDAELFFEAGQFADPAMAINYIAARASKFGHFSLINRVATRLQGLSNLGAQDVQKACQSATREMQRQ